MSRHVSAVVARLVQVRREVVEAVVVDGHVRGSGIRGRRLDVADPGLGGQTGNAVAHVRPCRAVVTGDLHVAVVGADPDHARLELVLGDGEDRGVEFGGRVVEVYLATGIELLLRVVGGEVRADHVPRMAVVVAAEDHVAAPVHRARVVRRDDDRRVPVEAVPRLEHSLPLRPDHERPRLDRPHLSRVDVRDAEVAALGVRVDQVRLTRHRHGVEAVAAGHRVEVAGQDAAAVVEPAGAAPVAVVLQPAAHVVRIAVVHEDVVVLRQAEVAEDVEVGAAVVRHLHAAVRTGEDPLAVFRIDPVRLVVPVHVVGDAVEGATPIGRLRQPARERVQRLVVGRVDEYVGVVEGPEVELVLVVVDHLPGLAVVVGPEERARSRVFGDQVDDVRTRLRHADADPGHGLVRRGRDLLPRDAAVARDVERGLLASVVEAPGLAAEGPHAGVDVTRVRQVDVDVRAPRVLVDEQHVVPRLATVGRAEDAALPVGPPLVAHGADQCHVGVAWVHHDALDALAVIEAEVGPGGTAVGRAVHAVAVRDRVARVALAGTEPDDVVVGGGQRQRAHRVGVLVVPLVLECHTAVGGLPDAPVRRSDPEGTRITRHGR